MTKPTSQYDPRYRLDPVKAPNPGARKRARMAVHHLDETMRRITRRPENIEWFESLLREGPTEDSARPPVGYFCNMIPPELILACGGRPVRLDCGNAALVQTGEEVLSGEICPVAKASFAMFLDPENPVHRCRCLVLPSSCDAKRKLGEVLADYRPTFTMNLPAEQDAGRYLAAAAKELERLADFLSRELGTSPSRRRLMEAIDLTRRRTALVRELDMARADKPGALSVRDFFIMIQSSFTGVDLVRWEKEVGTVLEHTRKYHQPRERLRPRLVLTGAPILWPNFKVLNLVEECGADIVGDTLCTGVQSVWDPVSLDETGYGALLRALAARYIFAAPCPCFVSQGRRVSRVLELAEERRAQGVLHYGLRLCQLFDVETYRLNRVLRQKGIPFLNLRTDYSLEDTEQLRVRLEAFLETVEAS